MTQTEKRKSLENDLRELLDADTISWEWCHRVASLSQVIRIMQDESVDAISNYPEKELTDILPALSDYILIKKRYISGMASEQSLLHNAERLSIEIREFISAIKAHASEKELEIFNKI